VFLEHKMLLNMAEDATTPSVPLAAGIRREGTDVTIVGTTGVYNALRPRNNWSRRNFRRVIDLRTPPSTKNAS
jgi:pyruvate/2-oxoglutarate/acetoin dehydrogenase E1 component